MGDWRVSLGRVVVLVAATLFVFLVIGCLGLLSLFAADTIIREGDVFVGFLALGAMFFFCFEVTDLISEVRDASND